MSPWVNPLVLSIGSQCMILVFIIARLRLVVAEVQLWGSASATFEQDPKSSKDLKSKHQMISNSKDNLRITWGQGGQALLFCGWMSKWLEPRIQKLEHRRDHDVQRCQLPRNGWKVVNSSRPRYLYSWNQVNLLCKSCARLCLAERISQHDTEHQVPAITPSMSAAGCLIAVYSWYCQTARLSNLQQWLEAVRWASICLCGGPARNFCSARSPAWCCMSVGDLWSVQQIAINLIQFVWMEADPRLAHSAMPCEVVGGRVAVFDENVAPLPVFLSEMASTKYYEWAFMCNWKLCLRRQSLSSFTCTAAPRCIWRCREKNLKGEQRISSKCCIYFASSLEIRTLCFRKF